MQATPDKINSAIAALLSARSFYQFHLDQASLPLEDIMLIRQEVELIDQILDNEVEKDAAIEALLEICESLELRPSVKGTLEAALKKLRTTMMHTPNVLADTAKNNGTYR